MIEIAHLTKSYPSSKSTALEDLSLTIPTGEFFGLLGPNGAGKTTLISILSTLLLPTEGEIRIDGELFTRSHQVVKRKIALVTQHNSLRSNMTPDQIMELQGRLYAMPKAQIHERREQLLEFCGLTAHRNKIIRTLSGGMKRKLMLCRALLTKPEILILDEPTVGLDPASRRQIWELLRKINRQGVTILLTSHYIDEVQFLCRQVAFLDHGKLTRQDTPERLIRQLGAAAVDVPDGDTVHTAFFPDEAQALAYASNLNRRFVLRATTLEDVFLETTGRRLEGEA